MRLSGKTALVTGAASGIGLAVADLFEREGAIVLRADVQPGGIHLDVADEASWRALQVEHLDVLVASAGISAASPLVDTPLEEWRRVLAVNLDGAFLALLRTPMISTGTMAERLGRQRKSKLDLARSAAIGPAAETYVES